MATIALVDDHRIFRNSMELLIRSFGQTVIFDVANGFELEEAIKKHPLPDIILLDINMPIKDGYATAFWLKENYSEVKVIALSVHDDDLAIIRMLRNGAKGYLIKDCLPEELETAVEQVMTKGFYHTDIVTSHLMKSVSAMGHSNQGISNLLKLTEREEEFIQLSCSDLTYKEIAIEMKISIRTVDRYRDSLFEKLQVKSRSGLVTFAFKHRLVMV